MHIHIKWTTDYIIFRTASCTTQVVVPVVQPYGPRMSYGSLASRTFVVPMTASEERQIA